MDNPTLTAPTTDDAQSRPAGTADAASAEEAHAESEIRTVLSQLPGFDGPATTWRWLTGGGAHKNFLVTAGDKQAVVKLWNRM